MNSTLLSLGGIVTVTRSSLVVITLVSMVSRTTANRSGTLIVPGLPPSGPRITRPCMPTLICTMLFGPIRHSRAVVPMVT